MRDRRLVSEECGSSVMHVMLEPVRGTQVQCFAGPAWPEVTTWASSIGMLRVHYISTLNKFINQVDVISKITSAYFLWAWEVLNAECTYPVASVIQSTRSI